MAIGTALTRPLLLATRSLQWTSAVIVMGLLSYFLAQNDSGTHLIYNECIAVISVVFFLPAFISPFMPHILSKFVVAVDLIFSYLWLTSFIFQAQDYDYGSCDLANPPFVSCSKKKASEAFTFLAFFFTFLGLVLEVSALWVYRRESSPVGHEKNGGRAPADAPVATA